MFSNLITENSNDNLMVRYHCGNVIRKLALRNGDFWRETQDFLVLSSEQGGEVYGQDKVFNELAHIANSRGRYQILTITCDLFAWPSSEHLPEEIRSLKSYDAIEWSPANREGFMTMLLGKIDPSLLKVASPPTSPDIVAEKNGGEGRNGISTQIQNEAEIDGDWRQTTQRAFYFDEFDAHVERQIEGYPIGQKSLENHHDNMEVINGGDNTIYRALEQAVDSQDEPLEISMKVSRSKSIPGSLYEDSHFSSHTKDRSTYGSIIFNGEKQAEESYQAPKLLDEKQKFAITERQRKKSLISTATIKPKSPGKFSEYVPPTSAPSSPDEVGKDKLGIDQCTRNGENRSRPTTTKVVASTPEEHEIPSAPLASMDTDSKVESENIFTTEQDLKALPLVSSQVEFRRNKNRPIVQSHFPVRNRSPSENRPLSSYSEPGRSSTEIQPSHRKYSVPSHEKAEKRTVFGFFHRKKFKLPLDDEVHYGRFADEHPYWTYGKYLKYDMLDEFCDDTYFCYTRHTFPRCSIRLPRRDSSRLNTSQRHREIMEATKHVFENGQEARRQSLELVNRNVDECLKRRASSVIVQSIAEVHQSAAKEESASSEASEGSENRKKNAGSTLSGGRESCEPATEYRPKEDPVQGAESIAVALSNFDAQKSSPFLFDGEVQEVEEIVVLLQPQQYIVMNHGKSVENLPLENGETTANMESYAQQSPPQRCVPSYSSASDVEIYVPDVRRAAEFTVVPDDLRLHQTSLKEAKSQKCEEQISANRDEPDYKVPSLLTTYGESKTKPLAREQVVSRNGWIHPATSESETDHEEATIFPLTVRKYAPLKSKILAKLYHETQFPNEESLVQRAAPNQDPVGAGVDPYRPPSSATVATATVAPLEDSITTATVAKMEPTPYRSAGDPQQENPVRFFEWRIEPLQRLPEPSYADLIGSISTFKAQPLAYRSVDSPSVEHRLKSLQVSEPVSIDGQVEIPPRVGRLPLEQNGVVEEVSLHSQPKTPEESAIPFYSSQGQTGGSDEILAAPTVVEAGPQVNEDHREVSRSFQLHKIEPIAYEERSELSERLGGESVYRSPPLLFHDMRTREGDRRTLDDDREASPVTHGPNLAGRHSLQRESFSDEKPTNSSEEFSVASGRATAVSGTEDGHDSVRGDEEDPDVSILIDLQLSVNKLEKQTGQPGDEQPEPNTSSRRGSLNSRCARFRVEVPFSKVEASPRLRAHSMDPRLPLELREFAEKHQCEQDCYKLVCPHRLARDIDYPHQVDNDRVLTNLDILSRRRLCYLLAMEAKHFLALLDSKYISACRNGDSGRHQHSKVSGYDSDGTSSDSELVSEETVAKELAKIKRIQRRNSHFPGSRAFYPSEEQCEAAWRGIYESLASSEQQRNYEAPSSRGAGSLPESPDTQQPIPQTGKSTPESTESSSSIELLSVTAAREALKEIIEGKVVFEPRARKGEASFDSRQDDARYTWHCIWKNRNPGEIPALSDHEILDLYDVIRDIVGKHSSLQEVQESLRTTISTGNLSLAHALKPSTA